MTRGRIELRRLAACAFSLAVALPVHAETLSAALVVTRAPGVEDCPDANGIAAGVRSMTRADPLSARPRTPRDTWLQVEFAPTLSGYRAVITARGRRQGARTIDDVGPGCASLADAVTLTLVMLLDPEVARANTSTITAPDSLDARPSAQKAAVSFGAEAAGGATLGILAHGAAFVEAGARVGFARSFGVALGAGFVFPNRTSAPPGGVTLDLWYGYARLAGTVFERAGTRLSLFVGPSLGSLGGSSDGFDYAPDRRLFWVAGEFGVEVFALLSGPISWTARIFAVAPFRYEGFYVSDAGDVQRAFRTPGIGAALSLGVSAAP